MNIDAPALFLHLGRVDLAHVAAFIGLLHAADVESKRPVVVERYRDARAVSHHPRVQGQNRLVPRPEPANLKQ